MKNSYKKMFIFELIIMILLLFNSFINNILSNYIMIIFLLIVLFIFNRLFVVEKQNKRYAKDIILSMTIFFLVFFILYYLFGLITGFAKTESYNFNVLFKYIIPLVVLILLKEFLRFQIVLKINKNKKLTILTIILFILMDVTTSIFYKDLTSFTNIFYLVALYILPSITTNIFLTFLTEKVGYKPSIYYMLITKLYSYLLPIVPNPSEYIYSVINLFLPLILYWLINKKLKKEEDEDVISRVKKNDVYLSLIIPTIIAIVLVYFTCGEFKYSMVAIASGSMSPEIKKGDAVIIEKLNNKKMSELKKGDIIAYKYSDVLIIHRIENIEITGDKYYIYTKGDANTDIDEWVVEDNMIVGKIISIIPYLGKPTVWVRSL